MSFLASYARYVQNKLGFYDKQCGDHSLEQRILEGIGSDDVQEQKTFLIDVDVVRGSVFAKNKPRHGWTQAFFHGILRSLFAPFYWNYWSAHMSFRWAIYVMFHFALQFTQVLCFLLTNPSTSRGSQDDVVVPFLLAIGLGILHYHITSAHGSFIQSPSVISSGDPERRSSVNSEVPDKDPWKFSRRTSTESEHLNRRRIRYAVVDIDRKVAHSKGSTDFKNTVTVVPTSQSSESERSVSLSAGLEGASPGDKDCVHSRVKCSPAPSMTEYPRMQSSVLQIPTSHLDPPAYFKVLDGFTENGIDLDYISSVQVSKRDMLSLPRQHPALDYNKRNTNNQPSDGKQSGVPSIVDMYFTGPSLPFSRLRTQPPLCKPLLCRSYSVHFPICDLNVVHVPTQSSNAQLERTKQLRLSCSSLFNSVVFPNPREGDPRWPYERNPYSDFTLSSETSTSSGTSHLRNTKLSADHSEVGSYGVHVQPQSNNYVRSFGHQMEIEYRSEQPIVTDPFHSTLGASRPRAKVVVSKSLATLFDGPSNRTNEVASVVEKSVCSLPTDSIPIDHSNDFHGRSTRERGTYDQNHNETAHTETEDSGIAFNGASHCPPDRTRSSRIREHPRCGMSSKHVNGLPNSTTAVVGRWSAESDTEQDVAVDQFYSSAKSRQTTEYTCTHSTVSTNHRVAKIIMAQCDGGRITSETECDRIGSDVGASDVDSSSGLDDIDPLPPAANAQPCVGEPSCTSGRLDACQNVSQKRNPSTKSKQGSRVHKRTRRPVGRQASRHSDQEEQDESASDSTDFNLAENENAWIDHGASTDSERSSSVDRSSFQKVQQQQKGRVQSNASLSNTVDGSRLTKFDHVSTPWMDEHVTSSRPQPPTKLLNKSALQDTDARYKSLGNHSVLDSVRCFVWEGENNSKINLTMLDIGYTIIRAVERQGISADYIILAFVMGLILPLLSGIFHWITLIPSTRLSNHTTTDFGMTNGTLILNSEPLLPVANCLEHSNNILSVQLCVLVRLAEKILFMVFAGPHSLISRFQYMLRGQWLLKWLSQPDLPGRLVIFSGFLLRFNVYGAVLFLLCIAEMTFQQRLLYAKYFFSLTSARRARKYRVPQFRLNKLGHIKCWLTLRSYLKKRGPQRSVETMIAAAFYMVFFLGLGLCSQLITRKEGSVFSQLTNWDVLGLTVVIILFLHRLIILGTKITKKYRNFSVLITEQINLYLSMEKKPQKKEELMATFQVLRLVEGLLKEVDGPFRVCGWTINPLVYNIFKLVLLSCFSSLLSETLGFKLKLYKLKLNAANW